MFEAKKMMLLKKLFFFVFMTYTVINYYFLQNYRNHKLHISKLN